MGGFFHRSLELWGPSSARRKLGRSGALGIAFAAAVLACGPATAQKAPVNPIEAFFSSLFGAPPTSERKANSPARRGGSERRRAFAHASVKSERATGGGAGLVCVRTCDGAFFPFSTSGVIHWDRAEEVCSLLCPNATMAVYWLPFGHTIDEAVSLTGQRYSALPNAGKFQQSSESECSCRRAGQTWADALHAAEARYGHGSHDILVTQEASDRMSRPVVDPKAKVQPASLAPATSPAAPEEPQQDMGLDINGVDTGLKAATAAISREASGIKDEDAKGPIRIDLKQGRIVEGLDPDGARRRIRVLSMPSE